jgi:hypothetical protein
MKFNDLCKEVTPETNYKFTFSVCTIVSNSEMYAQMFDSFIKAGFTSDICEFLYVNNTEKNTLDAYAAYNHFLQKAQGKYIILCHQDIELIFDNIFVLKNRIEEVEKLDPKWALLGNAGATNLKYKAIHITHGIRAKNHRVGNKFPVKAIALDENFIIARKDANLACSSDLNGFHFYGSDLCIIADVLGYSVYVIDFHILHKSLGNADYRFYALKKDLQRKYLRAFRGRFFQSATIAKLYLTGNKTEYYLLNNSIARSIYRQYLKLKLLTTGKY